jgi:hypothetical protein
MFPIHPMPCKEIEYVKHSKKTVAEIAVDYLALSRPHLGDSRSILKGDVNQVAVSSLSSIIAVASFTVALIVDHLGFR